MKAYIQEPQFAGDFYYLLRAEREPKYFYYLLGDEREPQLAGDFYYLIRAKREPWNEEHLRFLNDEKQRKIIEYFPNHTPITFIQGYCFAKNITLVPNPNTQAK